MNKLYKLEEIDALILEYKKGDKDAGNELLDAFEGFIVKYVNFLKEGMYSNKDRDILGLISLFSKDPKKKEEVISVIRFLVHNQENEDIYSQLCIVFIKCIEHFTKQEGPHFSGYLYKAFKYDIYRWLKGLKEDAMQYAQALESTFIDPDTQEEKTVEFECENKALYIDKENDMYENILTSKKGQLDNLERYILYMHYAKDQSDQEICEILGTTRSYISKRRLDAVKKLKQSGITLEDFKTSSLDSLEIQEKQQSQV